MKIIDEALLQEFREADRCEWCGKRTLQGCDPAHVFARGIGGGGRLDIRPNLVSLCRVCHCASHAGLPPTLDDLVALVGKREGIHPDNIKAEIHRLRRLPKGAKP